MIETAAELFGRELSILLVLSLLGSGPAALLPGRLPVAARAAMAPALGLALGSGVLLSAAQLLSMSTAAPAVLVPLVLASGGLALWRARGRGTPGSRLPLLLLAAAVSVPLALVSAPLIGEKTVGPAGYRVSDAAGYVQVSQALDEDRWTEERFGPEFDSGGRSDGRVLHEFLTGPIFQHGANPLAAAIDALFGWAAIDSQSAYLAVLVAVGAAGAFAFLLTVTGLGWAALLGAILFAGPVTYQLFIDSSGASLGALALIGPLAMAGTLLPVAPLGGGAALGLLAAGVATLYPSFMAVVAGATVLGLAVHLARAPARGAALRAVTTACAAAALVGLAVSPVAVVQNVRYAKAISDEALEKSYGEALYEEPVITESFGRRVPSPALKELLPRWDVSESTAPAWLTGSRDIYSLDDLGQSSPLRRLGFDVLFPLLFAALALLGALRFPAARVLLPIIAVGPLLAIYGYTAHDCAYCGQRSLLPIAPAAAILGAAGVGSLALLARQGARPATSAVGLGLLAVLLLVVPLQRDSILAQRLSDGGAFLGDDARAALGAASGFEAPVALEGVAAGPPQVAGVESALLRVGAVGLLGRRPVVDLESLPFSYRFRDDPPIRLDPGYRFVLTRLPGIRTARRTVLRSGPFALQQRRGAVDVMVSSGVVTDLAQRDPSGRAWVSGPVRLAVAAPPSGPVSIEVGLRGPAAPSRTVCVAAPDSGRIRRATLRLDFEQGAERPPLDTFGEVPIPPMAVEIASLRARRGGCGRA